MAIRRINGRQLEAMLRNGLAFLRTREEEINRLNVFPVPDGDTGTNMCLTLGHGLKLSRSSEHAGTFLNTLSDGMLLGARGNSGVILSQFFKGFYTALSRNALIGPGEMRDSLISGYRFAYRAVVHPVEGTILSVAREGIEHIRRQITRTTAIETILAMYIAEMKKSLSYTPEVLPVLKEAGVVDSGAAGFITIFEGMLRYLYGETITPPAKKASAEAQPVEPREEFAGFKASFDEKSEFVDGYCTEFVLQFLEADGYSAPPSRDELTAALDELGDSIVAVIDGKRAKVHIHTKKPSKVIELAQRYGEFVSFKLENMQIQHNERDAALKNAPKKPLCKVAVVNGEGMATLFTQLGCDTVIDGGKTMNTSSQEFVSAFDALNSDNIVVLPNDRNIIRAAEQAAALAEGKTITVIPTKSCAEGYFACAMDIQDSEDADLRIAQMRNGADGVTTLSETTASRDYSYHEISCKRGEEIVLTDGELSCVSGDQINAIVDALRILEDAADKETMIAFRGKGVPAEREQELRDALAAVFPMLEPEFVDGGQEIYHWVIGVM